MHTPPQRPFSVYHTSDHIRAAHLNLVQEGDVIPAGRQLPLGSQRFTVPQHKQRQTANTNRQHNQRREDAVACRVRAKPEEVPAP
eukprot:9391426-Pyramimonas_sp.AAC.1